MFLKVFFKILEYSITKCNSFLIMGVFKERQWCDITQDTNVSLNLANELIQFKVASIV